MSGERPKVVDLDALRELCPQPDLSIDPAVDDLICAVCGCGVHLNPGADGEPPIICNGCAQLAALELPHRAGRRPPQSRGHLMGPVAGVHHPGAALANKLGREGWRKIGHDLPTWIARLRTGFRERVAAQHATTAAGTKLWWVHGSVHAVGEWLARHGGGADGVGRFADELAERAVDSPDVRHLIDGLLTWQTRSRLVVPVVNSGALKGLHYDDAGPAADRGGELIAVGLVAGLSIGVGYQESSAHPSHLLRATSAGRVRSDCCALDLDLSEASAVEHLRAVEAQIRLGEFEPVMRFCEWSAWRSASILSHWRAERLRRDEQRRIARVNKEKRRAEWRERHPEHAHDPPLAGPRCQRCRREEVAAP